jgi:hypothetical protein
MCQLLSKGAHVFSAVSGENQLQRLYFSADRTFGPGQNLHSARLRSLFQNVFYIHCHKNHVHWIFTSSGMLRLVTDILEGRSFFLCMVKKSKNRLLDPEDGGTTLPRNVDNCESTQRNIVNSAARTSNLASCTLSQNYTWCHDWYTRLLKSFSLFFGNLEDFEPKSIPENEVH